MKVTNMCDYTNRRNDNENWECPCPYRDRCERFSRNDGCTGAREGRSNCGDSRNSRNERNSCGICSLFRRCFR
ncbi:MAG: hypothetical protein IJ039_08140 [Clostridia bacterium]|nr:hypothetical protein [Clostridia bacterium]